MKSAQRPPFFLGNAEDLIMTVRRLLVGKSGDVSVIQPDVRVQDVIDQLETDDVGALVVTLMVCTLGLPCFALVSSIFSTPCS